MTHLKTERKKIKGGQTWLKRSWGPLPYLLIVNFLDSSTENMTCLQCLPSRGPLFPTKYVECWGVQRILKLPKSTESSLREVAALGMLLFCRPFGMETTVTIATNASSKTAVQAWTTEAPAFYQNNVILFKRMKRMLVRALVSAKLKSWSWRN